MHGANTTVCCDRWKIVGIWLELSNYIPTIFQLYSRGHNIQLLWYHAYIVNAVVKSQLRPHFIYGFINMV